MRAAVLARGAIQGVRDPWSSLGLGNLHQTFIGSDLEKDCTAQLFNFYMSDSVIDVDEFVLADLEVVAVTARVPFWTAYARNAGAAAAAAAAEEPAHPLEGDHLGPEEDLDIRPPPPWMQVFQNVIDVAGEHGYDTGEEEGGEGDVEVGDEGVADAEPDEEGQVDSY